MIEPDYDYLIDRYIGSEYGDMRRERAALMRRMIFDNDESVKPRIRELTLQIQEYLLSGNSFYKYKNILKENPSVWL